MRLAGTRRSSCQEPAQGSATVDEREDLRGDVARKPLRQHREERYVVQVQRYANGRKIGEVVQVLGYDRILKTCEFKTKFNRADEHALGEWQGQLPKHYGLAGAIDAQGFARLSEGQDPRSAAQLVRHRTGQEYTTADGNTVTPVEHRAGWEATFSAPKSVSLTALVGGDDRVRIAHRAAMPIALTELERYTQARIGGNHAAETTGKFVAAKFAHETARPVDGYAASQLDTDPVCARPCGVEGES